MPLNNQSLSNKVTLYSLLQALKDTINYNMNCIKVATVIEFNPELLTVKCRVNNKRLRQIKTDGNQILENYPDIYAKAHFFGWGDVGSIYPIEPGMEGLLLFNDRELQTWFMTSEPGKLAYDRCHDLTDALFICGLHSQPKIPLAPYLEACLHIYYKNSDIQIRDTSIIANTTDYTLNAKDTITENTTDYKIDSSSSYTLKTTTQEEECTTRTIKATTNSLTATTNNLTATSNNITATTNHTGTITATKLNDTTAATGSFTSSDGKTITVVNGIVRTIVG